MTGIKFIKGSIEIKISVLLNPEIRHKQAVSLIALPPKAVVSLLLNSFSINSPITATL